MYPVDIALCLFIWNKTNHMKYSHGSTLPVHGWVGARLPVEAIC